MFELSQSWENLMIPVVYSGIFGNPQLPSHSPYVCTTDRYIWSSKFLKAGPHAKKITGRPWKNLMRKEEKSFLDWNGPFFIGHVKFRGGGHLFFVCLLFKRNIPLVVYNQQSQG